MGNQAEGNLNREGKIGASSQPFYRPDLSYDDNFNTGPFGPFATASEHRFKEVGEPTVKVFGQLVHTPFGIPAGPLVNGKFARAALDLGFNIVTAKTVRGREYPCQEWPNVMALQHTGDLTLEQAEEGVLANHDYGNPLAITNSFGVPSKAPEVWQKDLAETVKYAKKGQLVIGSFQPTTSEGGTRQTFIEDAVKTAKMVAETGVKVLEINLSCPNEGSAHLLCFDVDTSADMINAIKAEVDLPITVKIAYFADKGKLKEFVTRVNVDGYTAINTIGTKTVDEKGESAFQHGRVKTGACGAPIRWAGLEMVAELKKLRTELGKDYTIVGVGGVTVPEDYQRYRDAGADVVMSATGAMWNPYLAQEIKKLLPSPSQA